ncbi:formyltransferase family protein [Sphingosinicella sp. BN140058]|uniref:formyltransferase family protein n=1 Tax=Sphingosinicella sp. BN140058 TaxID=1892855 RepID=UPI0010102D7F|nr:formyltransferase family protein [Sphingosinicella sp. BN140058]QAY78469.1 hypothetical protein ETR14_19430 [Sphingosinicella sp. BN140058]
MRIIVFGTESPITLSCLEALSAAGHQILLVMTQIPLRSKIKRDLLRQWPGPQRFARGSAIPTAWYEPGATNDFIAAFRPDILCIATFKHCLEEETAAIARFGAINLHPSLLPRQRGPQTLFRIYHDGDLETGLTVHRATPRFDAGPIIVQDALSIPRGFPVELLERELALRAGPTLLRAIAFVEAGAEERAQDEAAATRGTRFDAASFRAPVENWPVEQSWHFLRGFCSRFKQPLTDEDGRSVTYASVGDYVRSAEPLVPGKVDRTSTGWRLHCNGGFIHLLP